MALRLPKPIRTLGPLAILVPLIVFAVMWLGFYSYRYVEQLAASGSQNLVAGNGALADMVLLRIDENIQDTERQVFNSIDLGSLDDPNRLGEVLKGEPAIESVIVLDDDLHIIPGGSFSKKDRADFKAFGERLEHDIIPLMQLRRLRVGDPPSHFYRNAGRTQTLLSVTHRNLGGERSVYVVVEVSVPYLLSIFPRYFESIEPQCYDQVLDSGGQFMFGHRNLPPVDPRLVVTRAFPSTLAGWTLRVQPRVVPQALRKESTLRPFDLALIALASLTILVGLGVLVMVVRAERRANRIKSEFVANVSHELKTPLSLIKMFGELLAAGRARTPDSAREYAEIITRESERLATLIDNVLDFARLERGKMAFSFAEGDVGEVVHRSLEVYRTLAEREGVALEIHIEPELPPVVIDADALSLAVMNLVDNALKYAQNGKQVTVSVTRLERPSGVRLAVADRGPGIAADEQERIFDRFYRGKTASERPVRGSGIGLSLVKNIALAHGGDVTVTSTPGQGSTFSVTLPAAGKARG
jgi:two-component system phosphate regulon sensor histidine kinase PhoR